MSPSPELTEVIGEVAETERRPRVQVGRWLGVAVVAAGVVVIGFSTLARQADQTQLRDEIAIGNDIILGEAFSDFGASSTGEPILEVPPAPHSQSVPELPPLPGFAEMDDGPAIEDVPRWATYETTSFDSTDHGPVWLDGTIEFDDEPADLPGHTRVRQVSGPAIPRY